MKGSLILALAAATAVANAQFVFGGVNVSVISGTTSAATAASIWSFVRSGPSTQTGTKVVDFNSGATGTRLTNSGAAASEGALSMSSDGRNLTYGGYDTAAGTASVAGTTAATVNRVAAIIPITYGAAPTITYSKLGNTAYDKNNLRSVVTQDGTSVWTGGPTTGVGYSVTGSGSTVGVQTTVLNTRVLGYYNGDLYASSATSTGGYGIFKVGGASGGFPTASASATSTLEINTGTSTSPYGFYFANATTCYVADDAAGLKKWTKSGGVWSATSLSTTAIRGLAGEQDGNGLVTLWATSADGKSLLSLVDNGSGSFSTIASAPTGSAFRGVAVPEPASFLMIGLGFAGLIARRRRNG